MSIENNNNNNNHTDDKQQQQPEHNIDEDGVALIGIGCRFPGGSTTPQQFYDQLLGGLDGISSVTAERWSKSFQDQGFVATDRGGFLDWSQWTNFDNSFFGILPKEATLVDPQVRLYLQVIWEALEDAHIDPATVRGSTTSTFLGQMYDSILNMQNRDLTTMSHSARFGRSDSSIKASYHYDFRGESVAVDTACSSSMIAILMGVDTIRSGKSDISIVAGVNATLEPTVSTSFTYMNMLGKKGLCASFDESAEGYARSEGLGVLVLKRLSKAIADNDNIYCVVKGGSSNVDGNFDKPSPSAPSAAAQEVNTRQALKNVGLTPSDIYYVECHGTGTPTGDPMEMSSITKIFRGSHTKDEPLRIGSVKSNIGHTESAAAVASLIKCAMMIKNKMLVKNINFKKLNPKIDLLDGEIKIVLENEPIPTYYDDKLIRMGINSFGITGSNSHLIIEEFKSQKKLNVKDQEENNNTIEKIDYLIPFSANTKKSMDKYIELVKNNIDDYKEKVRFEDFVKTQSLKTRHPSCQKVIVASDWESFKESSRIYERQQTFASNMSQLNKKKVPQVVMVFCGQGAQWSGMGEKLYANENVFRQAVDQVDQILSQHYQYSIIAKLRLADSQQIHHPILAQPSTFIIQVALVQLYKHFGVTPQIVIGHSFGDVTAAWCSGIISLEEACRIVYVRSVAQNDTIGSGRMLSVSLSVEQYNERFQSSSFNDVSIACYNAADSIVLAGNEDQLRSIDQQLKNDNIFSAFLGTPCAFHTDKQDATKEYIFSKLEHINYQQSTPSIKYYSTSTSQLINSSTEFNAQYIFDNLRHPVLFQQSINNIIANEHDINDNSSSSSFIYLEIAPHTTLSFYLKTLLSAQQNTTIMSPLNRKKDEVECIQSCLSQLYFGNVNVDFLNQASSSSSSSDNEWKDRSRLLPRYQWDAEYHWDEQPSYKKIRLGGVSTTILGIRESPSLFVYEAGIDVNRPSYQYLKGHKVKGKYLFPGTGYIENILTAWPGKDITIHNLNFINPFFLKEGVESKLKTTFTSYSATEYQVKAEFLDNASSKWIKASVGRISVRNPSTPKKKYPSVEQLRKDTYNVATRTSTDVYDKLIKLGLPYGETFRRVLQIQLNKDRGLLSEVDVQPRNHFEEENTVFNASVLDCILHAGLTNFQGEGPNSEKVFERVQGAQFFANNIPKSGTVKTLFSISERGSQNIQRGNEHVAKGHHIIDQDGNILANCGSLVTTSLTKVCKIHQAKFPVKHIKESVPQPKNSPSLVVVNNDDKGDVVSLVQSFIKSAKSSSHKVIRILYCMAQENEMLAFDIVTMMKASLENDNSIAVIDYNIIDRVGDMDSYFPNFNHDKISMKLTKDIDLGENLTEQGFLASCYDLILTTTGDLKQQQQQFHQLLNPNGHLIILNNQKQPTAVAVEHQVDESQQSVAENNNSNNQLEEIKSNLIDQFIHVSQNNNLLISRKPSIFEMELEKIDHILFITPSSSSSSEETQKLSTKLIQQANLITHDISFFSSSDIMDDKKNQQLIDAIGYSEDKKVVVIDLSTLDPMNVGNLVSKSMEYLRLQQIIRREKLQIKLISLRTSTLNDCLSPITREFNYKSGNGLFSFESLALSISKDACNHVSIKQILQISNYHALGEGEFKLELDENEMVQANVERLIYARDVLKPDSRFTVTDPKELVIKFEKDSRYHLRSKQEVLTGDQVEIKVMAASLNFKDCLILDGGVPQSLFPSGDVYDPPFGQDCAGIVTRVGPNVTKFKVGDEVYGAASGSFTSHVMTDQSVQSIGPIPKGMSYADAASIVTTMGTAHHALYKKGNISPDDSVIIHSASGGVGLAALNILKTMGHRGKVFATIGSAGDKMEYLKDTYGSFITAILLSSDFTQDVLDMTDGEGVQYILNTLDHSRMQDNFSALSPSGTILDLSIDQFANLDNIGTHMLRYQRAYIAIHFSKNHYSSLCAVQEMFSLGLQVPPIKLFPCQDITKAMDHMKSRTHIGKVILDFEHIERDLLPSLQDAGKSEAIVERHSYELDGVQGTLMMTGQTGVAAECLYYLIKHAPKLSNIIIVTHSKPKFEMQWLMHTIQSQYPHLTLHFVQCDVSNYDQLKSSIKQLYESNTKIEPVKVLLHCANQYMATAADDINLQDHQRALSAKAIGAWNLHHLFEELGWKLNHFHLFSSMAQYLVKGNTSYGVGNAFLDGLARHRRECGLEGTAIAWGSIGSAGQVAIHQGSNASLSSTGLVLLPLSYVYGVLRSSFINQTTPLTRTICGNVSPRKFVEALPFLEHALTQYLPIHNKKSMMGGGDANSTENKIITHIAETLSIERSLLSPDTKLKDYGVDSMVSIQLKTWIDQEFGKTQIINHSQISNGSINSIIETIQRSKN
ncbi:hypothetical protein DFA_09704 [Cavenderia fasciculata]|uniref:Polyketide synthase n=1 Tax=Cavenderia fasciculata TaxID=261658 RepID=F4Q8D2_CACFS|nr:uncharacterized protein DFA_09704 [Cavenderia fasciculata]EGG16032.1 hypothetical protein DFA_09704 [Cavenderia fasciculata]|eukprot:XP_004352357.1 hypothetical protein DFA_09704 [Cavenderia fasciculata]